MIPQRFRESNRVMRKPAEMTEEECFDIHAFVGGGQVITCWRPTPEELVKLNLGEPVWLTVIGQTMPPVAIVVDSPFAHSPDPVFP